MTVKELIEYLKDADPNDRVLIATKMNNRYGQSSGVDIAHTYDGFDWDHGNLYIVGNLDIQTVPAPHTGKEGDKL